MRNRIKNKYPIWLMLPAALFFSVFFILPNLSTFVFAFTDWSIYYLNEIKFNGLENFIFIAKESTVWKGISNSLYFAFVTVFFKNLVGFVLALIVNRELKSKTYLRGVFFLPSILSPMIVAVIFSAIYNPNYGIINVALNEIGLGFWAREWIADTATAMNSVCLMEIWQGVGFHMFIYLAGLQMIDKMYYEAANIDGANYLQKLKNITIPLIAPTITVNFILSLINGLKVFGQVYGLTNGGPADSTQVISTLIYKAFANGLLGYGSAISLLFTMGIAIITLTIAVILRKREVEIT